MIFRPELAKQVRMGKKTEARWPVSASHTDEFGITRCPFKVGAAYGVKPGARKKAIARVTVLSVRREPVGNITFSEAKREGFKTTQDFKDYWIERYGNFDPNEQVWVIAFRLGDWTGKERLLAANPSSVMSDYTTEPALAARYEPAPLPEDFQAELSREGRERDAEREAERRGRGSASERAARLACEADSRNRTKLTGDLRALEQYVEKVESEIGATS